MYEKVYFPLQFYKYLFIHFIIDLSLIWANLLPRNMFLVLPAQVRQ